jgi:hypothetical protein
MNEPGDDPRMSIEMRKQLLITQGAMYRSGIKSAKEKMVNGLHADTLARTALKQVGLAALSAWRNRVGLATGLPAIVPMVVGGVSKLWQQPKVKPVLRGVAIAGAVASIVALAAKWAIKKSKSRAVDSYDDGGGDDAVSDMPAGPDADTLDASDQ